MSRIPSFSLFFSVPEGCRAKAKHSSAARQLRDSSDIVLSHSISISVHQRCKDVPYSEVGRTKWHCTRSTGQKKKKILRQGSVIKYNNRKSTRSQRDKGGIEEEERQGQLTEKAEGRGQLALGWIS